MRTFETLEPRQMLAADYSVSIFSPPQDATISLAGVHTVLVHVVNSGSSTSSRVPVGVNLFASTDAVFDPGTDVLLGSRTFERLPAHKSTIQGVDFTVPEGFAAGDYFLFAVVDPTDQFDERSEANNVSAPVRVEFSATGGDTLPGHGVDLSGVLGFVRAPTTVIQNQRSQNGVVKFDIMNSGDQTVPRRTSADVRAYLRPVGATDASHDIAVSRSKDVPLSNLAPAKSRNHVLKLSLPSDAAAGQYTLIVKIDEAGTVAETNENNNTLFTGSTITIAPASIDLAVTAASMTSSSAHSAFRGSVTITNLGNTRYRGDTTVQFFFRDGNGLETAASEPLTRRIDLRPERSRRIDRVRLVSAPPASQELIVRITAAPGVTETTLDNNVRVVT